MYNIHLGKKIFAKIMTFPIYTLHSSTLFLCMKLRKHNMNTENFDATFMDIIIFVEMPKISNERGYILVQTYVGIIFMV